MKRGSLIGRVFFAILAVALVAVLVAGLIARGALEGAFGRYLTNASGSIGPGGGMGRQVFLGAAEQTFLGAVDGGMIASVVVAFVLAAFAAWLLARYLLRPLEGLTQASRALAAGDLTQRVEEQGPDEVGQLAVAFNEMADSLSEAEDLRRRLVSDVAHELRNPIAALRAQVEGISDGVLPADEARIGSLVEDVKTLSRLVDDLQELSVAEAGRLRYERGPFDLRDIVSAEIARARIVLSEGVALEAKVPAEQVAVVGDEFRIGQVLRNLLSNAARHTRHGALGVTIEVIDGWVRVTVTDTGEGIPPDDLPHIWQRFYRADDARGQDTGGTGLGLAISRRIVEDHGGRVFARSVRGEGSAIGFELPYAEGFGEDAD